MYVKTYVTPAFDVAATPRKNRHTVLELTPTSLPMAAKTLSPEFENLGTARRIRFLERPSSPALTRRSDTFDSRPDPFLDHRSFKLGKDSHYSEQRLASRRRRVDALLMNEQVHLLGMDLRKKIDEV